MLVFWVEGWRRTGGVNGERSSPFVTAHRLRVALALSLTLRCSLPPGFIAMNASMASGVVDVCLVPEIKFKEGKLLAFVDRWVLLLTSRGLRGRGAALTQQEPDLPVRHPTLCLSPISRSRSLSTAS